MLVRHADAPRNLRERHNYKPLIEALFSTDGWVVVQLDDVGGMGPAAKQTAVHQAAGKQGLKVNTAIRDGQLYIRRAVL